MLLYQIILTLPAQALRRRAEEELHPISLRLLRLPLLRFVDSNFPGNSPWPWEFDPLTLRFCLSQQLRCHDAERKKSGSGTSIMWAPGHLKVTFKSLESDFWVFVCWIPFSDPPLGDSERIPRCRAEDEREWNYTLRRWGVTWCCIGRWSRAEYYYTTIY